MVEATDFLRQVRIDGGPPPDSMAVSMSYPDSTHMPPLVGDALGRDWAAVDAWAGTLSVTPTLISSCNLVYSCANVVAIREGDRAPGTITYAGDVDSLQVGSTPPGQFRTDKARGLFQLGSAPVDQITCVCQSEIGSPFVSIQPFATPPSAAGATPNRTYEQRERPIVTPGVPATVSLTSAKAELWQHVCDSADGKPSPALLPDHTHPVTTWERLEIATLKYELEAARAVIAAMAEADVQRETSARTEEVHTDRNPASPAEQVKARVDTVIDDLSKRRVSAPDKARLGQALEKADQADKSREGADRALGNAIGRPVSAILGLRTIR